MHNKRWSDKNKETNLALDMLRKVNGKIQTKLSNDIIDVASAIKTIHRENDTAPLSLGIERVLGLYQANRGRRWYDRIPSISTAMKTISTLPENDYTNILEGVYMSLKD